MLKDIKNMKRCSKRSISDDSSTRASLMNAATGEVFPIKEDTENSSSGTFLNCVRLPRTGYLTELQHGDLIGFGDKRKIALNYKFILDPTVKKKKLFNEHHVFDVPNAEETFKSTILKLQSEILNLRVDLMVLRNKTKTESAELKNLMSSIKDVTNIQMTKETCQNNISNLICLPFKLKTTLLEENDRVISFNLNESESLKRQFYTQLENEFQCSICSELVYKAVTVSCNHTFCDVCIKTWRLRSNICPVCRATIRNISSCLALDNYITKICDFMGGTIQEQRQQLLKERFVPVQTAKRGRKKGRTNSRRHPEYTTATHEDGYYVHPIEVVDLTNSIQS